MNRYKFKNSLEESYAKYLEERKQNGEIVEWFYEMVHLQLDGGCVSRGQVYTPDFVVTLPNGDVEYHETKGFFFDRDKVRTKQAAARYLNNRFYIVTRKRKQWHFELITHPWDAVSLSNKKRLKLLCDARARNNSEYIMREQYFQREIQNFLDKYPKTKLDKEDEI